MTEDDILQHCLEEIDAGRRTAAECAALYPQVADLLQQLEAAEALMAWPPATLRAATARRHQSQLRAALARQRQPRRAPALAWWPRLAAAAALMTVLVMGGVGTLRVAAGSLPGQPLYAIKRAGEAVQGAFVVPAGQAAWHTFLAEERLDELDQLAARPTAEVPQLQTLAAEVSAETDAALGGVALAADEQTVALLERLVAHLERQQAVLARVRNRVPDVAQASIDQAMTISRAQRERALERLAAVDGPPGDGLPPGLASRTPTAQGTATATRTATMTATTRVPPGQARKTATSTFLPPGQANKTATVLPPGHERQTATVLPPGHARQTATAQAQPFTPTPPGNSGGQGSGGPPNCSANSPNSPNYCTPTPGPPVEGNGASVAPPTSPPAGDPPPTACPLNPAGNPVCSNRP